MQSEAGALIDTFCRRLSQTRSELTADAVDSTQRHIQRNAAHQIQRLFDSFVAFAKELHRTITCFHPQPSTQYLSHSHPRPNSYNLINMRLQLGHMSVNTVLYILKSRKTKSN